ncbi:glycosyltransferase family 2 protein [Cellulomonas endometrii]|uniref:glycosyltransferase family 2 protein n=1 Tax=Cellulomonas endometrii TaxID=3036301 RepID=UPI0024AC8562|nr:hypothetical protein [Cellulomonas endometrii]
MTDGILIGVVVTSLVPAALEAVRDQRLSDGDIDVLVLDETPDVVRSGELADACEELGLQRYRSPRPLGATRAMNLVLRAAAAARHRDAVLTTGADVLARGTVDRLRRAARANRSAVVLAWSDELDEYTLECTQADALVRDRELVDAVAASLDDNFGDVVFEVPFAGDGCVLLPTEAVEHVGLLDPVLEDRAAALTDWSLRAKSHGRRVSLVPGTFVARPAARTDPPAAAAARERLGQAVIDLRFPQFRDQLVAFRASGLVADARVGAARRLVVDGARRDGYALEVGWLAPASNGAPMVRCHVPPEPGETVRCTYRGFIFTLGLGREEEPVGALAALLGGPPRVVNLYDRGRAAEEIAARTGLGTDHYAYPTRV